MQYEGGMIKCACCDGGEHWWAKRRQRQHDARRMVRLAQGNLRTDQLVERAGGAAPQRNVSQAQRKRILLRIQSMRTVAGMTTIPESCLTKYITGRRKELDQLESFRVIRRVKKSEATDGTHVRMKITAHNKGDLVRWRLVSVVVNQYERHDVFAGTPASNVIRMLIAKAASHSHTMAGVSAQ